MMNLIIFLILGFCLLNLARMTIYIITSDVYTYKRSRERSIQKRNYTPYVSVVVPAHNEENTIERALLSLYNSTYSSYFLEVIIINDGSTDNTRKIVEDFQKTHKDKCKFRLLNRKNRGKAGALNYALKNAVNGKLVMCLDSDSFLAPTALYNAVQHFRDRGVITLSSNVNVVEDGTLLTLIQRFEYIICYQMKKGQALLGIEYIVGGIGSMFRYSALKKVNFYDTNTMTEDIDLTMKLIANKTKKQSIAYAADSIVYTEAAHSISELKKQRFRWKYGRSQTFYKNSELFFARHPKYAKRISWFALPFSIIQDLIFFTEPLVVGYLLYVSVRYSDLTTFRNALIILTGYVLCNVWATDHLKIREKLRLSYYAPTMYLLMYLLSYAEYFALIKSVYLLPKLATSLGNKHTKWDSPTRRRAIQATYSQTSSETML